jgi:hypothetical protein
VTRFISALWHGDVPLSTTFWEYGVVYGLLVNAAAGVASLALFSTDESLWGLVLHFLPAPYNIFILVAIWRAAGKYRGRTEWATAAKIAAVIVLPIASIV